MRKADGERQGWLLLHSFRELFKAVSEAGLSILLVMS